MKLLAKQCEKCGADIFRSENDAEPLLCIRCQRKPGRPPRDGESATGHIHIRTTLHRKSAWVRAAKGKPLAEMLTAIVDKAVAYESPE